MSDVTPIIPSEMNNYVTDWQMSPGLGSNGHLVLTGMTGVDVFGNLPKAPEIQIRTAFKNIGLVLHQAGCGFEHLVEMTSYHTGLQGHLDLFREIRFDYVVEPNPAWTAIEVAGLVTVGAIVETRAIARVVPHD